MFWSGLYIVPQIKTWHCATPFLKKYLLSTLCFYELNFLSAGEIWHFGESYKGHTHLMHHIEIGFQNPRSFNIQICLMLSLCNVQRKKATRIIPDHTYHSFMMLCLGSGVIPHYIFHELSQHPGLQFKVNSWDFSLASYQMQFKWPSFSAVNTNWDKLIHPEILRRNSNI